MDRSNYNRKKVILNVGLYLSLFLFSSCMSQNEKTWAQLQKAQDSMTPQDRLQQQRDEFENESNINEEYFYVSEDIEFKKLFDNEVPMKYKYSRMDLINNEIIYFFIGENGDEIKLAPIFVYIPRSIISRGSFEDGWTIFNGNLRSGMYRYKDYNRIRMAVRYNVERRIDLYEMGRIVGNVNNMTLGVGVVYEIHSNYVYYKMDNNNYLAKNLEIDLVELTPPDYFFVINSNFDADSLEYWLSYSGRTGNTMGFYRYLGLTEVLTNSGFIRRVHSFQTIMLGGSTGYQSLSLYYKYIKNQ